MRNPGKTRASSSQGEAIGLVARVTTLAMFGEVESINFGLLINMQARVLAVHS